MIIGHLNIAAYIYCYVDSILSFRQCNLTNSLLYQIGVTKYFSTVKKLIYLLSDDITALNSAPDCLLQSGCHFELLLDMSNSVDIVEM